MNTMVREIQPWILVNGRNGIEGDFVTPEGHMSAPTPWKPWEACLTLNDSWSYVIGDDQWKTPSQLISMLLKAANGKGNLLLGIGPLADGSIPIEAEQILKETGQWLSTNGESIFDSEIFNFNLEKRGTGRSDWSHCCEFSASGNNLFIVIKYWEGKIVVITGLEAVPIKIVLLKNRKEYPFDFNKQNGKLIIKGLPEVSPGIRPVFRV